MSSNSPDPSVPLPLPPPSPSPASGSPSKMDKATLKFRQILSLLPHPVQREVESLAAADDASSEPAPVEAEPEELQFAMIRRLLPAEVMDVVDSQEAIPASEEDWPHKLRWCLCKAVEGEFPRVRICSDLPALIHSLGEMEGQEASAWAFLGIPMRMTTFDAKRGCRYLLLPGEQEAVRLPRGPKDLIERMDRELIGEAGKDFHFQIDGWLGDPALSEPNMEEYYAGEQTVKQQRAAREKEKKPPATKPNDDPEEELGDPVGD